LGLLVVLALLSLPTVRAGEERDATAGGTLIRAPQDESSITLNDAGLLDVHIRDVELATVLEMLSYQTRTNIVGTNSVQGRVSANLYSVTLEQALEYILRPSQFAYLREGDVYYVGTRQEILAQLPPPQTRVFRLRYITRAEAAAAVEALLGPRGKIVDTQTSAGSAAARGSDDETFPEASVDYLIVSDDPDRLQAIADLLDEIDVRPKQILIEATLLRATLNDQNDLGIDFTLLSGVDFQNVASVSNAATDLRTNGLRPEDFQNTTLNVNTNLIGDLARGGITFGVIHNSVALFLRALEDITDVTVVANPKIVALNKQPAEVIVGRRDGYLTTTVTETAAVQTVEFLETGTQIRFTPVINDDGTVRLDVHPKDSNGGLTADNLPFEETTEAHAQILLNDGDTVLIGGLFRERTVHSRSQVPLLGDIPGVGLLFQKTLDQTIREEVIILLTVHILTGTPDESRRFDALLEDVERIRVGSRRGLLGSARERLAQAFYAEALRQVERGNPDAALLNVRMALHNHPRHLAARRLQERLLGRRIWDSDGTRTRTLILELLDASRPQEKPRLLGRPPLERELFEPPKADDGDATEEKP